MKEVAILLLFAIVLNGCGSGSKSVQSASGGVWGAAFQGGEGSSSGFSFITQFTLSGGSGGLSISNFQLDNSDTCFGGGSTTESGDLNITYNAAGTIAGTFSFTLSSAAGDVVTMTSTSVAGNYNSTTKVLSGGSVIGTWAIVPGSGSTCVATSGTFTMMQATSG